MSDGFLNSRVRGKDPVFENLTVLGQNKTKQKQKLIYAALLSFSITPCLFTCNSFSPGCLIVLLKNVDLNFETFSSENTLGVLTIWQALCRAH